MRLAEPGGHGRSLRRRGAARLRHAVMQLVEGRDAGPERRASEVIDATEEAFAACLCPTLEGKTAKQKNPNETGSLAWISWIPDRGPGPPASAAGAATPPTAPPAPKRWPTAGTGSRQWRKGGHSAKMCESASLAGRGVHRADREMEHLF